MKQIIEFTDEPNQTHYIVDENGNIITFTLRWKELTSSWYYDIGYNTFISYGNKLVNNLNIVNKFRNLLPFGIACLSNDDVDPFMQNDFVTQRIKIYTLTADDLASIDDLWGKYNA